METEDERGGELLLEAAARLGKEKLRKIGRGCALHLCSTAVRGVRVGALDPLPDVELAPAGSPLAVQARALCTRLIVEPAVRISELEDPELRQEVEIRLRRVGLGLSSNETDSSVYLAMCS